MNICYSFHLCYIRNLISEKKSENPPALGFSSFDFTDVFNLNVSIEFSYNNNNRLGTHYVPGIV